MLNIIDAPMLDIDVFSFDRFGHVLSDQNRRERKLVANLLQHCINNNFHLIGVYDGETHTRVIDIKSAMELIFNLDDSYVYFQKLGYCRHYILLTLGEGIDVIADNSFSENDEDGFCKFLDTFDSEQFFDNL